MFKTLFSFLKPCAETGPANVDDLLALLSKDNIGILSAVCCDAKTGAKDEELHANLVQAMEKAGVSRPVVASTITATRQNLRELGAQANDDQKQFKDNLAMLFQSNGLAAFPMLIINGRIAFYGGVPSADMIQQKLQSSSCPMAAAS
jgi:hypothetical protein